MKKRRVMVLLVMGLIAVGLMTGAILANTEGDEDGNPRHGFASRVAAILGLGEDKVQDAFGQASQEMQDEGFQQKMGQLFENGKLTQEQSDEYTNWFLSRPEGLGYGLGFIGGPGRGHAFGRFGMNSDRMLDRMVKMGKISEEQAQDYSAWLEARPEGPDFGEKGRMMGKFNRGGSHFGGRGRGGFGPGTGNVVPDDGGGETGIVSPLVF